MCELTVLAGVGGREGGAKYKEVHQHAPSSRHGRTSSRKRTQRCYYWNQTYKWIFNNTRKFKSS